MKQDYFVARLDGLSESLVTVLSKNRSSLSIADVALLKNVIISLEELKKVKVVDRKEMLMEIIPQVVRIFVRPEVINEITKVLDNLSNF